MLERLTTKTMNGSVRQIVSMSSLVLAFDLSPKYQYFLNQILLPIYVFQGCLFGISNKRYTFLLSPPPKESVRV